MMAVVPMSTGYSSLMLGPSSLPIQPPLDGYVACNLILIPNDQPAAICTTPDGNFVSGDSLTQSLLERYQKQLLIEEIIRRNRLLGAREFAI